jgi:hypothetical protein
MSLELETDQSTGSNDVCSQVKTGSDRPLVKPTRLTQPGHQSSTSPHGAGLSLVVWPIRNGSSRMTPCADQTWQQISTGDNGGDRVTFCGAIMRRRLEVFIPIVVVAVLVQLMAPIAAFRVVAYATSDPLYLASICSGMTSTSETPADPASTGHHRGDCCAYCVGSHGGAVAVDPPPLIFVSLQRRYQQISWLEATEAIPVFRVGSNSQARAPPPLT